jgi:hypothetical protein
MNRKLLKPTRQSDSRRVSDKVFGPFFVEILDLAEDCVTAAKLVGLGPWKILGKSPKARFNIVNYARQFESFDDMGVEVWKQGLFT